MELNRRNTKVTIGPVDHFVGPRFSRRTWCAGIALIEGGDKPTVCQHSHGHQTIEAAKRCGIKMWKNLPAGTDE